MIPAALLALAVDAGTPRTAVALGAGGGLVLMNEGPYVGDLRELGEGLGGTVHQSDGLHPVPILSQAIWHTPSAGGYRFGVELTERWWWVWGESRSYFAASAKHRIDRSVIAADAAVKFAFPSGREGTGAIVGIGPALYWIGTRERGWLGDRDEIDVRLGFRGSVGVRIAMSPRVAFVVELSAEVFKVPGHSALLRDGGSTPTGMLSIRLEGWL